MEIDRLGMLDVTGVLDDRGRLEARINEAVRRMFERYPPR